MTSLWIFSSSSEAQVSRCLEKTVVHEDNKWLQLFSSQPRQCEIIPVQDEGIIEERDNYPIKNVQSDTNNTTDICEDNSFLCDNLDSDIASRFSYVIESCIKNKKLLLTIANYASQSTIERFCNKVFSSKGLNSIFIQIFLEVFLPKLLTQGQSWFSLDLLVKASKTFPAVFISIFLPVILKDLKIQSSVLHDFIQTIGIKEKSEYMDFVARINLDSEQFCHHLLTLNILYKNCEKTLPVQNYISTNIVRNMGVCSNDKNYGRLFLSYLQSLTEFPNNLDALENALEYHSSPFKRPCMLVLKKLIS